MAAPLGGRRDRADDYRGTRARGACPGDASPRTGADAGPGPARVALDPGRSTAHRKPVRPRLGGPGREDRSASKAGSAAKARSAGTTGAQAGSIKSALARAAKTGQGTPVGALTDEYSTTT